MRNFPLRPHENYASSACVVERWQPTLGIHLTPHLVRGTDHLTAIYGQCVRALVHLPGSAGVIHCGEVGEDEFHTLLTTKILG